MYDNHLLFTRGKEKFFQDLDLVTILNIIRRVKIINDLMFTHYQRNLQMYSQHFLICADDIDETALIKTIPKYKWQNKTEIFQHNAMVHGFVSRYVNQPFGETDTMLVNQISPDILEQQDNEFGKHNSNQSYKNCLEKEEEKSPKYKITPQ